MLSPTTRKTILRLIRGGSTVAAAAKEAKVSPQTVTRLLSSEGAKTATKPATKRRALAKTKTARRNGKKTTPETEKPLGEKALAVDWRALYLGEKKRLSEDTAGFLRDVLGVEDQDNYLIAATAAGFSLSQVGLSRGVLRKYPFEG